MNVHEASLGRPARVESAGPARRGALIILALLLIPLNGFYLFYVGSCTLLLLFGGTFRWRGNRATQALTALAAFALGGALLRTILLPGLNPRDIVEVFRFVPLLLLYAGRDRWQAVSVRSLVIGLVAYQTVDTVISIAQFLGVGIPAISSIVRSLYVTERHLAELDIAHRAMGLSPGPGQHGSLGYTIAIFLLYIVLARPDLRALAGFGLVAAWLALLLSQSRSSLIVAAIISICVLAAFTFFGRRPARRAAVTALGIVAVVGVAVGSFVVQRLRYVMSFLQGGFDIHSYTSRLDKWEDLIGHAFEKPWLAPIGWGKDYFGAISGAMDSEYVFVFCVYGALVFAVFLALIAYATGTSLGRVRRLDERWLIAVVITGGAVIAWPSAYITMPNIMLLLGFLHLVLLSGHDAAPPPAAVAS